MGRAMGKMKKVWTALFIIYLCILFRITVFRSGMSFSHLFENGTLNLIPFKDLLTIPRTSGWFRFIYLTVGNIVWFVPFGAYFVYRKPKNSVLFACLSGLLLSFLIEFLQYMFGTGVSETDDLILNTLGTLAGALAMKLWEMTRRCFNGKISK